MSGLKLSEKHLDALLGEKFSTEEREALCVLAPDFVLAINCRTDHRTGSLDGSVKTIAVLSGLVVPEALAKKFAEEYSQKRTATIYDAAAPIVDIRFPDAGLGSEPQVGIGSVLGFAALAEIVMARGAVVIGLGQGALSIAR